MCVNSAPLISSELWVVFLNTFKTGAAVDVFIQLCDCYSDKSLLNLHISEELSFFFFLWKKSQGNHFQSDRVRDHSEIDVYSQIF